MYIRSFALAGAFLAVLAACGSTRRNDFNVNDPLNGDGQGPGSLGTSDPNDPNNGDGCATSEAEAVKPPVDVIVSVDQSGSMNDDIANVKSNINQLATYLAATGLDYRVVMIGEVGTGTYDICVPPPLGGPSCASNGTTFRAVNQHLESFDTLSLILSSFDQTSGDRQWNDFLRPDAVKAFVPVTDDNSSLSAANFDTQLLAKPGGLFGSAASRRYVAYPIVGAPAFPSESPKCGSNAVNTGAQYIQLAKLTNGKWFPICLTNFGPVFQEIANNIASTVACDLPVPEPTDGSTLDYSKVNVTVTASGGGSKKDVFQDSSKGCAEGADGWQYSADKTRLYLCGPACEAVRSDPGAKVSVKFGCETKVK